MAHDPEATATAAEPRAGASASDARRAPVLYVVMSCERPLLGSARHVLSEIDEVLFVRSSARGATRTVRDGSRVLVVEVPGTFVSREHARMVRVGSSWMLVDLGSRNGTYRGRERIDRTPLSDGDVFECGRTLFAFESTVEIEPTIALDRAPTVGDPFATCSPVLESAHRRLLAVARAGLPLLLLGESGTGKEVLARGVHEASGRAGAFVPVNCAALPEGLLESQLFGHTKGAFSGAVRDEAGYFRAADRGTLFLDELGDLPLRSQAAFLRALEESAVVPVGSTRAQPVDVRLVAATNRPLHELVTQGLFRDDLLARVAGYTHRLQPLRDHRYDLGQLVAALLPRIVGADAEKVSFDVDAALALLEHGWPLNVRELRHTLASAVVLAEGAPLRLAHVTASWTAPPSSRGHAASSDDRGAELRAALRTHGGNIAAVARAFGKAPAQVHRWLKLYAIDPNEFRGP